MDADKPPREWLRNFDQAKFRRQAPLYGIAFLVIAVWAAGVTVQRWREDAKLFTHLSAATATARSWEQSVAPPAANPPAPPTEKWPGFRKSPPLSEASPAMQKAPEATAPKRTPGAPKDSAKPATKPPAAALDKANTQGSLASLADEPSADPETSDVEMDTQGDESSSAEDAAYARPAAAPNGHAWPPASGYIEGYEVANRDGQSQLVIDNTQNGFEVFLKVVSLSESTPRTVRTLFIAAHDRYTVGHLRAGTYEVRYEILMSGKLLKSPAFALEESAIAGATRASKVTLPLQSNGDDNLHAFPAEEGEF
jgi:hypothetical protein